VPQKDEAVGRQGQVHLDGVGAHGQGGRRGGQRVLASGAGSSARVADDQRLAVVRGAAGAATRGAAGTVAPVMPGSAAGAAAVDKAATAAAAAAFIG